MLAPDRRHRPRRGVAAVEFAFVAPILFTLMLGVWEVGRLIQVQQLVQNATREGARIAAQGQIVNITGAFTQVQVNTGSPNVFSTVQNFMQAAGLTNTTGLNVTFQFIDGDTSKTQPYQGVKGQRFRVTTTVPFSNFKWTLLSLVGATEVKATVDWVSMADDPFTIDTSIPTGY
jgi:Flp pilus assembly protein TadG